MDKCCDECTFWDKENAAKSLQKYWRLALGLAALLALIGCCAALKRHIDYEMTARAMLDDGF